MPGPADPLVEALHAAARRWCIERHAEHARAYDELRRHGRDRDAETGAYSLEALRIFPRYQQLDAALLELEQFVPADFASLDEARAMLTLAVEGSRAWLLAHVADPIAAEVCAEERALLAREIAALDVDSLRGAPPMPYRRVLREAEAETLSAQLEARFGRWYGGVCDRPCPQPASTYAHDRLPEGSIERLRALVGARASRVFELNEDLASYELDVTLAALERSESFTFDATLDWMVYASHEATLTVAGALVEDVARGMPELGACRLAGG